MSNTFVTTPLILTKGTPPFFNTELTSPPPWPSFLDETLHIMLFLYADLVIELTPEHATVPESGGFVEFKLEVTTPSVDEPLPQEIYVDLITIGGTAGIWINCT